MSFNGGMNYSMRHGWLALTALVFGAASMSLSAGNTIKDMRVWKGPDKTRTVFDLSNSIDYRIFSLENPSRLVIDVKSTELAASFKAPKSSGSYNGVRTGTRNNNDLRIVLDLSEDARAKSFLLPPAQGKGHRLVVDLLPKQSKKAKPTLVAKAEKKHSSQKGRDLIVAIDAGHGGEDPGAIGATGTYEKDVALKIARELKKQIDQEPGLRGVLIRDGDYYIPLPERYKKAREKQADLFVSIHADAFHKSSASGSSVYVLSTRGASSQAAKWLAKQENSADLVGGVSLNDKENTLAAVLLDLSQNATMKASADVASHVLKGMGKINKLHKHSVQSANFVVLRSPDVPSILVETAFISNPDEERKLNNVAHQRKLAKALANGVKTYFSANPPPGTWMAEQGKTKPREHIVASGETLSTIAMMHGVSLTELRVANARQGERLHTGDKLVIPRRL